MSLVIVLVALGLLMLVAYRGFSVILFAPICALLAVLLTDPGHVPPVFSGVFMDKMVGFVKSYFPVFMLGAVFGKVIDGMDAVDKIARAPTAEKRDADGQPYKDVPAKPVVIRSVKRKGKS